MDVFNNLQVINECLLDKRRTQLFKKAINKVVRSNDIVIDSGTGTGIMALFAAEAGAGKVYACDIAEDVLQQARKNFAASPYNNKIEAVHADMKTFNKLKNIDVLIMEMLDTGMVSEQQGVAIKHLKKNGVISDKTQLIPYRIESYLEAIEYDFNFYGFTMPFIIQARNYGASKKINTLLSKPTMYDEVDFSKEYDTDVRKVITLKITENGALNAFRLRSKIYLHKTITSWGTTDMNMPVIIPVPAERKVKKGDKLQVEISYNMGEGFGNFNLMFV